jgi:hypothetical protein
MDRDDYAWSFEHSVECRAGMLFAWNFWTDVRNWALDADVESVEIDGPFAAGARGITNSRSSGRIDWVVVEAQFGRAVIEFPLPGGVSRSTWAFEETATGCRITQRWTLQGDQAAMYAREFGPGLEAGIPLGMQKLCATIENLALSSSVYDFPACAPPST